jgi:hypothetical protein
MYISRDVRTYYEGTSQCTTRGLFLLLIQPKGGIESANKPIKALVRKVAMKQLGHFMMGYARIYGQSIVVSGSYGGDGLTCSVPLEIYEKAQVTIPQDLYDAWNHGGGHNSCGSEAPLMRKWALENLESLRK